MKNPFKLFGHIVIIITLLIVTPIFKGCDSNVPVIQTEKFVISDSLLNTLKIDSVTYKRYVNSITLNGKISANPSDVVQVFPMVSGKIQDVHNMLGDFVKRGQSLGIIRSPEMAGFTSSLITAQTNLEVAKKGLQAAKEMFQGGVSSQKDFLAAKANFDQAKAELARIKEVIQLNGGGTQGDYYILKAPISGFIIEKNVTNGMDIRSDNGNDLFTISDLNNIWVIGNVFESNIPDVHIGDSVDITTLSYPDTVFHGKIDKIMNVLDPGSEVMNVRIPLANPGFLLKPGMFASVKVIHPENKQMLCVPSSSVIFDHSQYYVLVYHSRKNVIITPVQIAKTTRDKTYISSGLKKGERVIATNPLMIYQALNS